MIHCWTGRRAVLIVLMFWAGLANAQGPAHSPVFAQEPGPPPEPQFCPDVPGPVEAKIPLDRYDNNFPNGFTEPCIEPTHARHVIYGGVGALALQRERLGNGVIAVADPGVNFPGLPPNIDTGNQPPPSAPPAVLFNTAPSDYHWGVLATLGIQKGRHAVEATGFFISEQTDRGTVEAEGMLDVNFAAFPPLLGFAGNNFLWLQADLVTVELETQLASAELNYRYRWFPIFEWIVGARYVDLRERFAIITDDDGIVAQPPDPFRRATYETRTENMIYGGQIGFEVQHWLVPNVSLGLTNKNMIGINDFEVENRLFRGDGFSRPTGRREDTQLSGLIELAAVANFWFTEQIRLRAGYQIFWLLNIPEAHQQVNFNPAVTQGTISDDDSVFYHGPLIELQIGF